MNREKHLNQQLSIARLLERQSSHHCKNLRAKPLTKLNSHSLTSCKLGCVPFFWQREGSLLPKDYSQDERIPSPRISLAAALCPCLQHVRECNKATDETKFQLPPKKARIAEDPTKGGTSNRAHMPMIKSHIHPHQHGRKRHP